MQHDFSDWVETAEAMKEALPPTVRQVRSMLTVKTIGPETPAEVPSVKVATAVSLAGVDPFVPIRTTNRPGTAAAEVIVQVPVVVQCHEVPA